MRRSIAILFLLAHFLTAASIASETAIPFGIAVMPEARLLVSDAYDAGDNTREEAIARYGTQASLQDVIAFYQTAFTDAGFKVSLPSDSGDRMAITGKRDRDRIRLSVKKEGSWANEGENEITIVAVYDKK